MFFCNVFSIKRYKKLIKIFRQENSSHQVNSRKNLHNLLTMCDFFLKFDIKKLYYILRSTWIRYNRDNDILTA